MNNFTYKNSTEIVFGKDTQKLAGEKIKPFGKKVLFHYGSQNIKQSGLYEQIIKSLNDSGIEYAELGGVVPNPRLSLVYQGINICKEQGIDFVLAVGGGSVIDSAKAIAMGACMNEDVWNMFDGKDTPINSCLPVGVVLTIPASGSESSTSIVITNEEKQLKKAYHCDMVRPQFAIMNPELSYTLPSFQTACGISDMLSHVMERYFTDQNNVDVTGRMCESVMRAIMDNGIKVMSNPNNYDNRAEIMLAGTIAHSGFLGMGRTEDWASHGIEHELSAVYDIAHGAGLSAIIPAWMKYVYQNHIPRFIRFAVRVMDIEVGVNDPEKIIIDSIDRLEQFYKSLGLPTRLSDMGIDDCHFAQMAEKCGNRGSLQKLTPKDIQAIYKLAL